MTTAMMKALEAEIDFMENWLAYSDSLEKLNTLEEAQVQIDGMLADYDGDDFPEGLKDPATMMIVFNHCADLENERWKRTQRQLEDDKYAESHPEYFRFRNRYDYGGSAFFDPEQLNWELTCKCHYDDVHRAIIIMALNNYQEDCKND